MDNGITEDRRVILDRLYRAFEIVSEGTYVYLCDIKYDYSRWSEEAVRFFGLPGEYMYHAGEIWEQHILLEDQENYRESIKNIFSGKNSEHDMQYRARDRKGRYVVCTCRGVLLCDENGEPDYFAGTIRNNGIINSVDSLTGCQNQYGLFEQLNTLYDKQVKANIMMIGIDHFSTVNEMWGYDFGNMVIHKLVQLLKEEFVNEGVLYRVDGVRFVLLTHTLSIEELSRRYNTLQNKICEKLEVDGYHPNMLVAGSALRIKNFNINPQAMYSCLMYAFHVAKENRNGQLHIFQDEVDENRHNLMDLINTVRKSIEDDCKGFMLYYQPIVDAKTKKLKGSEALLRWKNEEYGLVPPNKFIPIIENDPAFVYLGEWILKSALKDTKPFLKKFPKFQLNVNVSYEQIRRDSFAEMVKRCLEETAYPPENLCLEITERCRLINISRLSGILSELRAIGVRFALDDFGMGYSSLNILTQLKCDVVKIDKVFVDKITEGTVNVRLIDVLNNMADVCGAEVCTEGVETKEQYEIIKECGVDSIQGYYFSKPVPLDSFLSDFVMKNN